MSELASENGSRLRNEVQFHIYFSEFQETKYTERPALDPYTVVSDIGGAMGIFLGASLMSLIDLIASVYKVLRKLLTAEKKKRHSRPRHHHVSPETDAQVVTPAGSMAPLPTSEAAGATVPTVPDAASQQQTHSRQGPISHLTNDFTFVICNL